jgi:hypothetical protein
LKVIGDLFKYFIVGPETDSRMRLALDGKLDKAGRKPIRKLKDDGGGELQCIKTFVL